MISQRRVPNSPSHGLPAAGELAIADVHSTWLNSGAISAGNRPNSFALGEGRRN
jgi:hypothetical protein